MQDDSISDSGSEGLNEVISQLVGLFRESAEDRPDSLMKGYPRPRRIVTALQYLQETMFPGISEEDEISTQTLASFLNNRLEKAAALLEPEISRALPFRWIGEAADTEGSGEKVDVGPEARRIIRDFFKALPTVRTLLIEDVRAAYEGDPAALTFAEVKLAYPGLSAITVHRIAHELYKLDVPLVPRIMSEWIHTRTGVDINPGAQIGHGFFIDHATGVVIGETTNIGNHVKIYQGVTLGARSFPLDAEGRPIKHIKRHPTVEDNVVIYANATILGGDTVIGQGSTIGGNVFLMESVPPNSFVASKHPELRIKKHES